MAEAARLADQVSHTFAVAGEIGGSILGGFLGALVATAAVAALGAVVALTFGAALVVFVLVGAAVGAAVHSGSMSVAKMFSAVTGALAPACSLNVFANSRNSARVTLDFAVCSGAPPTHYPPHPVAPVAEGSATVFINSMPAARKGDALVCGAKISEGSGDVFIGGATLRLLEVQDEVPLWAKIVGFIASIPAGMAGARIGSALVQGIKSAIAARAAAAAAEKAAASAAAESGAANRATFEAYKDSLRADMSRPAASNSELNSQLDKLYRPNAQVGSGSTAAAVRQELATGQPVGGAFHSQKAQDAIASLQKWLSKNPTASPGDRAVAENVIKDMQNALNGH